MNRKFRLGRRASVHLDLIRGVSAIAVMLGHVRGLFFLDFTNLARPHFPMRVIYAITGFGHQAVVVFFVLSGYFIGTSVFDSMDARHWSWRIYLTSRLTRLQLVLLPALVLGAIWDRIGMRLPQAAYFYYGALYKYYPPSVALRSTFSVFFGNLFFLQGIVSPVFGSNGPLWSLSYEFWYYLVFPALILAAASWIGIRDRFLYSGLALLLLWFVGSQISIYFLIWLMGALVGRFAHFVKVASPRTPLLPCIAAAAAFFSSLAWRRLHPQVSDTIVDLLIGICFAGWIYFLIQMPREDVSLIYQRIARALAGFSYSLYLTHFPALLLLRGLWNPNGNWEPDGKHLFFGVGLTLLMLVYAFVIARFTEAHTPNVRRRILQLWQPWSPRSTAV